MKNDSFVAFLQNRVSIAAVKEEGLGPKSVKNLLYRWQSFFKLFVKETSIWNEWVENEAEYRWRPFLQMKRRKEGVKWFHREIGGFPPPPMACLISCKKQTTKQAHGQMSVMVNSVHPGLVKEYKKQVSQCRCNLGGRAPRLTL